jgi:tetratricopeptide (TPR) repeat protein
VTAAPGPSEPTSRLRAFEGSQAVALWSWAIILAAALAAYSAAFRNTHAYDDLALFRRYRELPPGALGALFDPTRYNSTTGIFTWRPLCFAGHYLIDGALFGWRYAPSLVLNLAIHALNALLLGALTRALVARGPEAGGDVPFAAGAATALLFAVHPMATEPVLCITFRVDLLSLTAVLACAWFARRLAQAPARTHALCGGALLLGLLHKESAAAATAVAPVAAFLSGAKPRAAATLAATLAAVTAAFLSVWAQFRWEGATPSFLGGGGRALGMLNFLVAAGEIYLPQTVFPYPSAFATEHHFAPVSSLLDLRAAFAGVIVASVTVTLRLALRGSALHAFLLALAVAGMAPVSQIVAIPDPVAERLAYPLVAALVAGLGALLGTGFATRGQRVRLLCVGVLLWCVACTQLRTREWESAATLNIANLRKADPREFPTKLATGGLYLMRAGELQRAGASRDEIDKALRIAARALAEARAMAPESTEALRLDAVRLLQEGRPGEALPLAERAAGLAPQDPRIQQLLQHLRRGS